MKEATTKQMADAMERQRKRLREVRGLCLSKPGSLFAKSVLAALPDLEDRALSHPQLSDLADAEHERDELAEGVAWIRCKLGLAEDVPFNSGEQEPTIYGSMHVVCAQSRSWENHGREFKQNKQERDNLLKVLEASQERAAKLLQERDEARQETADAGSIADWFKGCHDQLMALVRHAATESACVEHDAPGCFWCQAPAGKAHTQQCAAGKAIKRHEERE